MRIDTERHHTAASRRGQSRAAIEDWDGLRKTCHPGRSRFASRLPSSSIKDPNKILKITKILNFLKNYLLGPCTGPSVRSVGVEVCPWYRCGASKCEQCVQKFKCRSVQIIVKKWELPICTFCTIRDLFCESDTSTRQDWDLTKIRLSDRPGGDIT